MQKENKYYLEIEQLIKRNEINKKARYYKDISDTLITYWNVGRLIAEAQKYERAEYGKELIKKME